MLQEILDLGFSRVELGYDVTIDLVPGIRSMVEDGSVVVDSVHNFCPVPVGAPQGHPELFHLASLDGRERDAAIRHTLNSVELAAELAARVVVVHAGNVAMRRLTGKLLERAGKGERHSARYERIKMKLLARRARRAQRHIDALSSALDTLLPRVEALGVRVAIENLPSWESLPAETEMLALLERFPTPALAYWHDIGHAQVRENLGFISAEHWLTRLAPRLAGFHIHDVVFPAHDHLMPPLGGIDFAPFKKFLKSGTVAVLEPAPATPEEEMREGVRSLRAAWGFDGRSEQKGTKNEGVDYGSDWTGRLVSGGPASREGL
jgi:sugar phosphate isomerase/epimerase